MNLQGIRNLMSSQQQSLEQFVKDTHEWPRNDWEGFANHWKFKDVYKLCSKARNQVDTIISGAIDPKEHSLAYSYLLGFKGTDKLEDVQVIGFIQCMRNFLNVADPKQISLSPRPFTDAWRTYVQYMKTENVKLLIPQAKRAINILQGNNKNILTIAHCDLVEICCKSYCYHLSFPEIETDIIEVQGHGCIYSLDNLRYHYFAALAYIALKKFDRALEYLTMVCTAPSEVVSVVQVEAYKKYILVSLISKQQLIPLPRYTPRLLLRFLPKICSEYIELSNAFGQGIDVVSKLVEKYVDCFTNDYNFGLVQQVSKALEKFALRKLTSVYTRLSIDQLTNLCKFQSTQHAKKALIDMIQKGELAASIDSEGVVSFDEMLTDSDSKMLKKMHSVVDLWNSLDKMQLDIKKSPQYIRKILNLNNPSVDNNMQEALLLQSITGGGNYFRQ